MRDDEVFVYGWRWDIIMFDVITIERSAEITDVEY